MCRTTLVVATVNACLAVCAAWAQDAAVPAPGAVDTMPILRLDPGGPTSFVSTLAFNPQGSTLYAGGWDKVVRAWSWNDDDRRYVLDPAATYRVSIGPALEGLINAIAISPDGIWLAVAGQGTVRGASDTRRPGWKVPAAGVMNAEMRQDQGMIYLFNTRTRDVRTLRGHTAPVVALVFAPSHQGKPPLLVSAGREWDDRQRRFAGAVRAWDTQRSAYLGGVTLPDIADRPGIAAWHSGRGVKQLRVAIAWSDQSESLRVWDVESNTLRPFADGQYNSTVAWWPAGGRLITGSTGRLKSWNVSSGTSAAVERELPLAAREVPRAIALFSSSARGAADRLAVVVKSGDADATVRLRVVDLANFRLVESAQATLWDGRGVSPSLAAVPGGGHLAVAGNHTHEIATFATGDLLAGRNEPAMLRGSGIDARQVSFARKDGALGVVVSLEAKTGLGVALTTPAAGDLVFDPARRRVSNDLDGWQLVRPAATAWRAEVAASAGNPSSGGPTITVRQGDRTVRQILLKKQITAFALLPPQAPKGVPILAVATQDRGQPLLELYNAASGAVVRELSGHVAAIDALAFSDDGKLLASTAGDRTVCVWNLADLDRVVGARGALQGIVFLPQGQSLTVVDVAAESPYRGGQLAVGDKIVGWTRGQKIEPVGSIIDFYLQVSRAKPGETISLARQRGGQRPDTVQLVVVQGTDERKPLFTLFVAQGDPWSWIGWSPLGPYESSGQAIEQWLGWHFNTSRPDQPARFATAGEYQHLRRDGLIEQLLSRGTLPDEKPRALDRPGMSIRLKQPGQEPTVADGHGPLRVLGRQAELDLEIRGLDADQLESVTWRIGESEPKRMEPLSRQVWSAKLPQLADERRATPLTLAVTTAESEPQTFSEEISLVYQPPAPAFDKVRPTTEHTVVKEAALALAAEVQSQESATATLKVSVTHTAGGREVSSRQLSGEGRMNIEEAFELQPGDNTITLTATNGDALAGEETAEQTVLVRRLTYNPEAMPHAELLVRAVSPSDGQRRTLTSDKSDPLIVDMPTLALEGRITAQMPLALAEWSLNDKHSAFTDFAPNATTKLDINEQITLVPGKQRIACLAQTEGGLPAEVSLSVDHRPRLGELFLTAPETGAELIDGRDPRRVKVTGRIEPLADKQPFQAIVLVNGRPSGQPPVIDAAGETFSTEVELGDGDNRIEAQITNEWGARKTSEAVRVRYLRPPRVVDVSAPGAVDAPLADISFVVESPSDLKLTGLKVNDRELPLDAAVVEREGPDTARFKITAHDVPLRAGVNEIRPLARNAEGWSVLTKTAQVEVMLPPPPKAQIEFVSPAEDGTAELPEIDVRFVVRSPSRLKHVELRSGGERVSVIDVSHQTEEPEPGAGEKKTTFRLEASARVVLKPRDNLLRIVAVNDGGESESQRTVTYVRKPVDLVIDRLESLEGAGALVPEIREGGKLRFTTMASEGKLSLEGRIRWPDAATQRLNQVSVVHVLVNGFLQQPVALKPARPTDLEWKWKAKIRLNRSGENEVSVLLPGVARASDCRLDFQVKCSKPDERQRLHLLVVGVGERDARQLETLALRAVRGARIPGTVDQITTPAFTKGWIYLASGYVNRGKVSAQLERVHLRVGDPTDAGSDVVLVYFRGQETVDDRGEFYLLTSQSQFDPDTRSSAVSSKDLSERFSSVPGAQLILLDVQRQAQAANGKPAPALHPSARWPSEPQMAALRYAWLSNDAAPADARLLVAIDNAPPRATRLGEIESAVSRDSERARQKYGSSFEYEPRVPDALRDLVLVKVAME
jgi:WD40 repeat protein